MMMDNKIEQDIIDFNMVFSSIHHCLFCTLFNVVYELVCIYFVPENPKCLQ